MNEVPLEEAECKMFVQWLEIKRLKFNHIKNENPIKNPGMFMKLKAMGVRSGFPDYIIILRPDQTIRKKALIFFIEMKRRNATLCCTSPEQKEWLEALNVLDNSGCKVCNGAQDAIDFINFYLC